LVGGHKKKKDGGKGKRKGMVGMPTSRGFEEPKSKGGGGFKRPEKKSEKAKVTKNREKQKAPGTLFRQCVVGKSIRKEKKASLRSR